MDKRIPPGFEAPPLDMTLDGEFREPPVAPVATQITRAAIVIAVLAGMGAVALLALWMALALVPVALGAGLVAWAAIRFQQWRGGGRFGG
jgi:hypothetical protein